MNKQRRNQIAELQEKVRQAMSILEEATECLESIKDEEEEYYENMPEGIQVSEKGEKAEEAVSNLDSALDTMGSITSELDEVLEYLESAAE